MNLLAGDITHGHILAADWLFLIAAIGLFVAAVLSLPKLTTPLKAYAWSLAILMWALVALAWLLL